MLIINEPRLSFFLWHETRGFKNLCNGGRSLFHVFCVYVESAIGDTHRTNYVYVLRFSASRIGHLLLNDFQTEANRRWHLHYCPVYGWDSSWLLVSKIFVWSTVSVCKDRWIPFSVQSMNTFRDLRAWPTPCAYIATIGHKRWFVLLNASMWFSYHLEIQCG